MQKQISKSRFKAHALQIFRQVERSGEPVIITDRGRPALIVQKYSGISADPLLRLKDSVLHYERPLDPAAENDWEALA